MRNFGFCPANFHVGFSNKKFQFGHAKEKERSLDKNFEKFLKNVLNCLYTKQNAKKIKKKLQKAMSFGTT